MGKLASKTTKRIMASLLTIAMIMSNMTVYASEYPEPAAQTEDTVDNTGTDAVELPSADDETVQGDAAQDEETTDDTTQDEGTQDNTAQDEETAPGDDSDSTEKVDGDEEPAQEETDENLPEDEELDEEKVSANLEAEEPNKDKNGTPTIWIVGDSTVSEFNDKYYLPRYGYGTQIKNYLSETSDYTVRNLALSGRSSKSFLGEANYTTLKNGIGKGDILIVGFGHNDEKAEAARYTNPNGNWQTDKSFAKSLYDNYVKLAEDNEAEVILCTPVVRRGTGTDSETGKTKLSNSEKHITSTSGSYEGGDYRQAIIKLGKDKGVSVVDLTEYTTNLYEGMTPAETLDFHARTQTKASSVDNTHLNIYGAKMMAYYIAKTVKDNNYTALADEISDDIAEPVKATDLVSTPGWVDPVYTRPAENVRTYWGDYIIGEGDNQITFKATAFGALGGDNKYKNNCTLKKDDNGNMQITVTGNAGKIGGSKIGDDGNIELTGDGIAMYYYRLPVGTTFTLSATAVINGIDSNSQVAFGLMARDDMYIDMNDSTINSDYVVAGSFGNGGYNCFYRKDGDVVKGARLATETVAVGKSYDLSIVGNKDGYACTFGNEPTQSGGFDFQLNAIDDEYFYIGMFVARNADVTFSNISLEITGGSGEGDENGDDDPGNNPSGKKIDVWDFGAKQESNAELYNNNITPTEWLAYADSVPNGIFKANDDYKFGDVTLNVQGGDKDKLYTNASELSGMSAGTSYGVGKSVAGDDYTSGGAYFGSGTGNTTRRYITIDNVQAGDKIVLYIGSSNSDSGTLHFKGPCAGPKEKADQDDTVTFSGTIQKHEFIAKYTGKYNLYMDGGSAKPMYYRVMKLPRVSVSGTIDLNGVSLPQEYSLLFMNQTTNEETAAELGQIKDGKPTFTALLAPGYTYKAALSGATGYGFTNESASFTVENGQVLTGKNDVALVIEEKDIYTYSGKINGFAANYAKLGDLKIIMTPPATSNDDKVALEINKTNTSNITFSATLAPDVEYSIVLEGVNDYELIAPTVVKKAGEDTKTSFENRTITVKAREKYDVSGGFMGLSDNTEVTALTFTNVADNYVYDATINEYKDGYSIKLRDGEYLATATVANYSTKTHVVVDGGAVSKDLMFVSTVKKPNITYVSDIYVGYPNQEHNYATVSEAMEACELMERDATTPERITVHIAPGTYREQIMVKAPNVSFVNDSTTGEEVLLTWYYGIGYKYYSASGITNKSFYDAEKAYDKYEKNIASKWGVAVYVQQTATGFLAEGITFENSFNRYVTEEELADGVEVAGNESITFVRNLRSDVTSKAATERAAAIAIEANQAEFKDCSFYSSQDTLYTAGTAYFKNCIIEGQTDYICGSGSCVFDSCELSWKGYSINSQGGYVTAARPSSGEYGYLFRNCTVTANAHNNLEVVAGYWGRPWNQDAAVKFMNTKLQTASLIVAAGWTDMSGATAANAEFKEYNTTAMDESTVDITSRSSFIMTEEEAAAVNAKAYFGTWTPKYYTEDSETTVEISGELTLSDNGDINYVLPGHTLTVGYTLNSDKNNANDASIVKWYTVKYTDDTPGEAKLVKTANGAIDKTYKVSATDIGSYIKVTVTPGTVSGKTGTMKELTLYKDDDYDHIVNDGYYDPSTGSSSSLGDGVNVFLAGDSTTKDYSENGLYQSGKASNLGSWGEFLQCFFDESEVKIQNYANGGRSTRSFINDGSFDKIKAQIGAGDYLFIQFAHNDSSAIASKKDVYVPLGEPDADGIYPYTSGEPVNGKYPDYAASAGSTSSDNGTATYKWFLKQYVNMALDAGATPVLLTPVARMYVNDNNGVMKEHHSDGGSTTKEAFGYCKAVKQVYDDYIADGKNVLYIDAYTITADFYTNAWNETDKNANNKQVMSLGDSTHSNKLGGMLTAAAYAQELQKLNISISESVKAPSKVSALTVDDSSNGITAGKPVFNIDVNGNLTAYDLTKNCSERATYWEGIGTTILTAIKAKADELGSAAEEGAVATPTATLSEDPDAEGNVESGTTVTLNCDTDDATIYYTTDGSNPKVSKTRDEYVSGTTTITLTADTTIKAYAEKTNMKDSKIATFKYTLAPLVKAPTSNIESGKAVSAGTKIELETATTTEGVQIRYTMGANPANPTKYSTRYDSTTGIVITNSTTIKAIAVVGDNVSAVSTFTYTVFAAPAFSPKPADWKQGTPITLSAEGTDEIRYTTDSTIPTASTGTVYKDAINIETTTTITAISVKDGICSAPVTYTYTVTNPDFETLPSPEASKKAGIYKAAITVALTVVPSDASIYYTVDGSEPSRYSTSYKGAIRISETTTLKAFAIKEGYNDSEVATYLYTIDAEADDSNIEINDNGGIKIDGLNDSYPYTGAAVTPDFRVIDTSIKVDNEFKVLTLGVDYTVKYKNNKKAGDATVTVVGKGNYVGKDVEKTFKIKEADDITDQSKLRDLKGVKIDKIEPKAYEGEAIYPDFTLILKDKSKVTYHYDDDKYVINGTSELDVNVAVSNNINKGTATILVTGKNGTNNKPTSVKKTFKINAIDLSADANKLSVTVDSSVPYAVKGATPKVEVSYKFSADKEAVKLVNGKDYTVKYSANKKVGDAKVTITGKGNYAKKAPVKNFKITALDMADTELVAVTAYTDLKAGKVKAIVVDENGDMLKASQYTVKVFKDADCKNAYGTSEKLTKDTEIYVKAEAKDAKTLKTETATEPVTFEVKDNNIAKAKVKVKVKSKPYTGAKVELTDADLDVTLKINGKQKTLKMSDGDFEIVSYSNNINKGTATAVIQGTGDYSGTKTIKFKIAAKEMKKPTQTTP